MNFRLIIASGALATSACQFEPSGEVKAKHNWALCIFELDKIEAARGRNLDDLDKGGSVARNQFMMDCLWANHQVLTEEQFKELSDYAGSRQRRTPADMSLNNGKR